jgi:hypothetical protein
MAFCDFRQPRYFVSLALGGLVRMIAKSLHAPLLEEASTDVFLLSMLITAPLAVYVNTASLFFRGESLELRTS